MLRSAALVPAVVSGLWIAQQNPKPYLQNAFHKVTARYALASDRHEALNEADLNAQILGQVADVSANVLPTVSVSESADNELMTRKARVGHLLQTLERVAEVSEQMAPERAASLEPVIADLAERSLALGSDQALRESSTDAHLSKLETTVAHLVDSLSKVVEPEMSL